MSRVYSPKEVNWAASELAEFIYQAKVTGVDKRILELMDTSETAFNEALNASGLLDTHDNLKRIVEEAA